MSLVTNIADAVAAELGRGEFSTEFTAQRRVLPDFELKDLGELKVSVVPHAVEIAKETRDSQRYEVTIDIGVQQKITDSIDTQVAALGTLVDEIAEFLTNRPLEDAPYANWSAIENDPVYVPEHLKQRRVFTSVLSVTYQMLKIVTPPSH